MTQKVHYFSRKEQTLIHVLGYCHPQWSSALMSKPDWSSHTNFKKEKRRKKERKTGTTKSFRTPSMSSRHLNHCYIYIYGCIQYFLPIQLAWPVKLHLPHNWARPSGHQCRRHQRKWRNSRASPHPCRCTGTSGSLCWNGPLVGCRPAPADRPQGNQAGDKRRLVPRSWSDRLAPTVGSPQPTPPAVLGFCCQMLRPGGLQTQDRSWWIPLSGSVHGLTAFVCPWCGS